MKVSIIIPVYNGEEFLSRCLDSVVNQVYKNIAIIIVDDSSTDNTREIIKNYAEKDNRIIPFYQTINKGVSSARNIGLKASTGDYIMFMDSDDEMVPSAIRRMVDLAIRYNSDFIDSYHLLKYTKKNGKVVSFTEKKVPKNVFVLGTLKDDDRVLNMYTYITGKLIKKSLFDGLSFDENLRCYEDMVLEHQLKVRINNYVFMNKVIYIYHQNSGSLINTFGKSHLCYIDASKKVRDIYKDYDKDVREKIEAMLVCNMFFTCISKIVKNDDNIDENVKLATDFLLRITEEFPNYINNKNINNLIKRYINKFIYDKDKLKRFIKKTKNIDFINIYFTFLSKINKYEIKNPLE